MDHRLRSGPRPARALARPCLGRGSGGVSTTAAGNQPGDQACPFTSHGRTPRPACTHGPGAGRKGASQAAVRGQELLHSRFPAPHSRRIADGSCSREHEPSPAARAPCPESWSRDALRSSGPFRARPAGAGRAWRPAAPPPRRSVAVWFHPGRRLKAWRRRGGQRRPACLPGRPRQRRPARGNPPRPAQMELASVSGGGNGQPCGTRQGEAAGDGLVGQQPPGPAGAALGSLEKARANNRASNCPSKTIRRDRRAWDLRRRAAARHTSTKRCWQRSTVRTAQPTALAISAPACAIHGRRAGTRFSTFKRPGGEEFLGICSGRAIQRFERVAFSLGQGDSVAGWKWPKPSSDHCKSNTRPISSSGIRAP